VVIHQRPACPPFYKRLKAIHPAARFLGRSPLNHFPYFCNDNLNIVVTDPQRRYEHSRYF